MSTDVLRVEEADYILNPGYLKLELMLKGLRVDETLFKKGLIKRNLPQEGVLGNLDLILPEDTWVNVSYQGEQVKVSPYLLSERNGNFYITNGKKEVRVILVPQPGFYEKRTSTGVPLYRIGVIHGGYLAITPLKRCEFFKFKVECKYCSGVEGGIEEEDLSLYSIDEILETVEAAYKEGKAHIVYITLGFLSSPDGGIRILKPYIRAIKRNFSTLISLEALPPQEDCWIDETYASGVDSVIYNLEIFDPELFKRLCPGRAELIGRERYLEALEYAASIFPSGTVASHLIVGLEPKESTIKGIDYLTDIGVIPILPIFKPLKGSQLETMKPPTTEEVAPIYAYLYKTLKRKRINMRWMKDISIVTTPLEGRFFTDERSNKEDLLKIISNPRLRTKAAWGLATIRRKLRVREKGED